jgi:transketolase
VRLDICAMKLDVVLVGIGAGIDYGAFGPSHHTMEDIALMRSLPGMTVWSPADEKVGAALVSQCLLDGGPAYLRLHRADGLPPVYNGDMPNVADGVGRLRSGSDVTIAATGSMVRRALEVADALAARGIEAGVIDVFRLKPFPDASLLQMVEGCDRMVTLEEHFVTGGLGSAVLELFADQGIGRCVQRFGFPDRFCYECGDRDYLHAVSGLDTATLAARIVQ